MAEGRPAGQPGRAALPHDRHRHGVQPPLHGEPGRRRPPGPTYTIDTLRDLRREQPDADLFFITGADALAQILSWKDVDELFDLAQFVGVTRPEHELSGAGLPADRVSLMQVPAMAISSTDCRDRVRRGEPVWYLVPDGVVQFIAKYGLYRTGEPAER